MFHVLVFKPRMSHVSVHCVFLREEILRTTTEPEESPSMARDLRTRTSDWNTPDQVKHAGCLEERSESFLWRWRFEFEFERRNRSEHRNACRWRCSGGWNESVSSSSLKQTFLFNSLLIEIKLKNKNIYNIIKYYNRIWIIWEKKSRLS